MNNIANRAVLLHDPVVCCVVSFFIVSLKGFDIRGR